jgi:peptidoglycan/xylan/chitin deacetylase (PgdA/CDA1 family)
MNRKIMCFPEGRKKAVTLSYDDCMEADEKLIAMMEKYQMRGTFNLIPGWFAKDGTVYPEGESYRLITASEASRVYQHPFVEVANHGNLHKYMTSLSVAEMTEDMIVCRKSLEKQFDRLVQGMAYPYGWYNEELMNVLRTCGIVYSRTVNSTHSFDLPKEWLAWNPTCHHDDEKMMELAEKFLEMKPDLLEQPKLMYVWGHTFEFDRNDNWNRMEKFMKKISGSVEIWYATNMEIYDYVKAYERLLISADGTRIVNPSNIPVWADIDGTIYKIEKELVLK